jgi:hypothetical protein
MCSESGVGNYSSGQANSDARQDISGNVNSLQAGSAIDKGATLA